MEDEDNESSIESLLVIEGWTIDDRVRAVLGRAWTARRRAEADAIERWVSTTGLQPAYAVGESIPDRGEVVRIIAERAQYVVLDDRGHEVTLDFETLRPARAPV